MIHPESIKTDHDTKNIQWSASGFITNIVIVLFWLINLGYWYNLFATSSGYNDFAKIMACLIMATGLNLLGFHLYALLKPDYGNTEEYEDVSFVGILKNHWAIISGTTLFFLAVGSFSALPFINGTIKFETMNVLIALSVVFVLYSVAGMICWGFVTNNRKNILARIVRPWQIYEQTDEVKARVFYLKQKDGSTKEVEIKASVLGFIVNIVLVLVCGIVFIFNLFLMVNVDNALGFFLSISLFSGTLILSIFHAYILFKPDYGYTEEDEELSLADVFKKHLAIISGTTLVLIVFNLINVMNFIEAMVYNTYIKSRTALMNTILFFLLNAVAGMISWGFVTSNKQNIFARIVTPWQIHEQTEDKAESV